MNKKADDLKVIYNLNPRSCQVSGFNMADPGKLDLSDTLEQVIQNGGRSQTLTSFGKELEI